MEEINYSENGGWMRYVMFKPLQRQSVAIASGKKMKDFKFTLIQKELLALMSDFRS